MGMPIPLNDQSVESVPRRPGVPVDLSQGDRTSLSIRSKVNSKVKSVPVKRS